MLDNLLSQLAPHYCCSCGEIGSLMCESCKYDIISEPMEACLLCGRPCVPNRGCAHCRMLVQCSWYAGMRSDGLEKLINIYKFDNTLSAYAPLGDLLLAILPDVLPETVVVPIPTVRAHIRQRGYDHTLLLARYVAKSRGLTLEQPLKRQTATVQRGADRRQRLAQAGAAFVARAKLKQDVPYLLIDDVVTTGATVSYGARALRIAGASTVWAAALARQPLDQ